MQNLPTRQNISQANSPGKKYDHFNLPGWEKGNGFCELLSSQRGHSHDAKCVSHPLHSGTGGKPAFHSFIQQTFDVDLLFNRALLGPGMDKRSRGQRCTRTSAGLGNDLISKTSERQKNERTAPRKVSAETWETPAFGTWGLQKDATPGLAGGRAASWALGPRGPSSPPRAGVAWSQAPGAAAGRRWAQESSA